MKRQRGVALLAAVILVGLAAVLSVAIAFSSTMTARRGAAVFSLEQGLQFAEGAEALAAVVLKADDLTTDTPAEAWAKHYGPIEVVSDVSLEAQLDDEQGKFNLNWLRDKDNDELRRKQFEKLLQSAKVETRFAALLMDWLDKDTDTSPEGGEDSLYAAQNPPYRAANMPITSISELMQLPGFDRVRYEAIAKYVTALPADVPLNVCSALGPVLSALGDTEEWNNVARLEENRKARTPGCFPTLNEYKNSMLDPQTWSKIEPHIADKSSYFRLVSRVRVGTTGFALYSLMYREVSQGPGSKVAKVRPILRNYGAE